jgi:rod shape-determining protein MreC
MREFLARHRRTIIAALGLLVPLFLLYVHGRQPRKTTIIEKALLRITSPAQSAGHAMLSGISDVWRGYIGLVDVASDNEALRAQVGDLTREVEKVATLEAENARLRQELEFKSKRRDLKLISAHVIGKDLSPYGRVLRIAVDAGEKQGLAEGMPILSATGLVGRVLRVSGTFAEVLLTVDARSTVNVRVLDKGVIGTVTGTSSPYNYIARMSYLHRAEPLEVGDLLVTSGHDKLFPPGLHVGVVRSLEERQRDLEYELQVTPSVNFADLELVQVVIGVEEAPPEPVARPRAPATGGR